MATTSPAGQADTVTPKLCGVLAIGAIAILVALNRGFKGISVSASVG